MQPWPSLRMLFGNTRRIRELVYIEKGEKLGGTLEYKLEITAYSSEGESARSNFVLYTVPEWNPPTDTLPEPPDLLAPTGLSTQ